MRVLDLGCGDGQWLLASAAARPDVEHVGVELIGPLVERGARRAERLGLKNVRFVVGDAVAWIHDRIAPGSVDEIHVYHPQPYYDPAVASLGMLTPAFFERAWVVLRPAGFLILQTDHKGYGRHLLEAARKHFEAETLKGPWPDAPLGRTRREAISRRKGLVIRRILARRRDAPLEIPPPPAWFEGERRPVRRVKRSRSGP